MPTEQWTAQKYGNVPALANVNDVLAPELCAVMGLLVVSATQLVPGVSGCTAKVSAAVAPWKVTLVPAETFTHAGL